MVEMLQSCENMFVQAKQGSFKSVGDFDHQSELSSSYKAKSADGTDVKINVRNDDPRVIIVKTNVYKTLTLRPLSYRHLQAYHQFFVPHIMNSGSKFGINAILHTKTKIEVYESVSLEIVFEGGSITFEFRIEEINDDVDLDVNHSPVA